MDISSIVFIAAAALAVVNALSLLAKAEALRGLGRVFGGLSWVAVGAFALMAPNGNIAQTVAGYVVIACGVLALGSGARKFARRNVVD